MKRLFPFLIVLLLYSPAGAATRYVSADGSGSTCSKASPCAIAGVVWADLATETSTVYFFGGTYTSAVTVTGRSSPTGTLYLKPCSASPDPSGCDSQVIFQASGAAGSTMMTLSNNTVLDGETSSGAGTRNIKFDLNGDYFGIGQAIGDSNVGIKYVEFTGLLKDPSVASRYIINASSFGSGLEISYNYFHDNWGHSDILAYPQTNDAYGKGLIHHNTIEAGTINYITGGCGGIDAYANTFIGLNATQVYDIFHFSCGTAETDAGPIQYVRIYNSHFSPTGDLLGEAYQNIFFEQNHHQPIQHIRIFNNTWDLASNVQGGTIISLFADAGTTVIDDVVLVNNTVYSLTNAGMTFFGITGSSGVTTTITNSVFKNNLFFNIRNLIALDEAGGDITWASESAFTFDYNVIDFATSGHFQWLNSALSAVTDYTSVSTFNTEHSTSNKTGDVSFVSSSDFRLQSGDTVAKDSGADLSALTNMPSYSGVSWPYDKNGVGRPQGAAWDIGAMEYVSYPQATIGVGPIWSIGAGATATIH